VTQKPLPQVLFACVHNAGRSQMAAALLERYAAGRIQVRSAGSAPAETVNPTVLEAMREIGIDLASAKPKLLDEDLVRLSDVVITMGCGDTCPFFPGKRYEDWDVEDPAGRDLATVRRIRDEIDARVRRLVTTLIVEPAPHG
jgi:arsenate reductase